MGDARSDLAAPDPERQAELRRAYEANLAGDRLCCANIQLRSPGEALWVAQTLGAAGARDLSGADGSGLSFSGLDLNGIIFVEANLAEDLRLSTIAGLIELSPYHFARAFKQSFGQSPHRYHVGRRIERAKALLAGQTQSITEIAQTIGFAETSSFSSAFRKLTGLSPREYRRGLD